jgi:dihydrofolate synthase/folylpolyglutamate synthase
MVFMPHWPPPAKSIELGLDRVYAALARMGDPHMRLPPAIHAAGTNGKGSTVAFLRSVLERAGYRVHAYTSPHFLHFNERVRIAGRLIDDGALYRRMEECRLALDGMGLTFFEATTVGAFLAFAEEKADFVLLETGLGGRLDATNVLESPLLSVITPISLDHTEYLGDTVAAIAYEKAGIMKRGTPCVAAMQQEEASAVLQEQAESVQAPLFAYEYDWGIEPGSEDGGTYRVVSASGEIAFPGPSLPGRHQIMNAGVAAACVLKLREAGVRVPDEAVRDGIRNAAWPGRLQALPRGAFTDTLPAGWRVVLDGAHNRGGAEALAEYANTAWNGVPVYLAVGQTQGRDPSVFLSYFKGTAAHVFGVTVRTEPSAAPGEEIAGAAASLGMESSACDSADDIAAHIRRHALPPGILLCCGSLYLLSDILRLNKNEAIY